MFRASVGNQKLGNRFNVLVVGPAGAKRLVPTRLPLLALVIVPHILCTRCVCLCGWLNDIRTVHGTTQAKISYRILRVHTIRQAPPWPLSLIAAQAGIAETLPLSAVDCG